MTLQVGDEAPDFQAIADNGDQVALHDLRGQVVVLYFYPKDDTPGCTAEACAFRDLQGSLPRLARRFTGCRATT
ncbi:hypothetical protein GCM10025858_31490 [Alicyclobacillus sacchari]|nr:hypothetical protein GCM10025858_31490 [Alicyclobacillus sacchari]